MRNRFFIKRNTSVLYKSNNCKQQLTYLLTQTLLVIGIQYRYNCDVRIILISSLIITRHRSLLKYRVVEGTVLWIINYYCGMLRIEKSSAWHPSTGENGLLEAVLCRYVSADFIWFNVNVLSGIRCQSESWTLRKMSAYSRRLYPLDPARESITSHFQQTLPTVSNDK